MSDTHGEPKDPVPPAPPADPREGMVDFDAYTRVGPGTPAARQAKMSEPISGGSIVSWAELLKHQPRPASEDEVLLGSLPELQIDAKSDNDIIKSLQRETNASGILLQLSSKSSKRIKGKGVGAEPPRPEEMPLAAKVFARQPTEAKAWMRGVANGDSSIDLMTAAEDAANPLADSNPHESDESSDVLAAAIHPEDGTSAVNLGAEPRASTLNSWKPMTIVPPPALVPPRPRPKPASRPSVRVKPRTLSAWVGGAAVGVAGAALVGAGLWLGGALPRKTHVVESAPTTPTVVVAKPTPDQAKRLLEAGDLDAALDAYAQCPESSAVFSGRGQARWLNYLRQQKRQRGAISEKDDVVVAARKDLVASKSAEGALWLGLINETFGHFDAAREAYDLGHDNYPNRARLFTAARSRLAALAGGKKVAMKVDPQFGLALSLVMLELPADAGGLADEAGFEFWDSVSLARKGDFTAGRAALLKARLAHEQRRDLVVRRGQNPESDPREDIFLQSCDQMLAWWNVQAKLQSAGFKTESPSQALDVLLGHQKKYDDAMKSLVTTLRVEKPEEIADAVDSLMKQRQQAVDRWKSADAALTAARGDVSKKDEELTSARKSAAGELQRALAQEAEARKALEDAVAARRTADESYHAIHARLVKAKLVGAKAEPADLVKALDTLLSADIGAKDAELARLRTLLDEARRLPAVPAPVAAKADPELAERLFSAGLQLYYAGKHAEAEEQLVAAQQSNGDDARYVYFLGLTRLPQGKTAAADAAFRRAAELERQNLPDSGTISATLERIQGPDRQVLNRYRR